MFLQNDVHVLSGADVRTEPVSISRPGRTLLAILAATEHKVLTTACLVYPAVEIEITNEPIQPIRLVPIVHVFDSELAVQHPSVFLTLSGLLQRQERFAIPELLARLLVFDFYISSKGVYHFFSSCKFSLKKRIVFPFHLARFISCSIPLEIVSPKTQTS